MAEKKQIDDGGAAFPVVGDLDDCFSPGMTLRQYYAGLAMQGILASMSKDTAIRYKELCKVAGVNEPTLVSYLALEAADALIKAEKESR